MSVCLFKCLFIRFSQCACFFNYTATLCHYEQTSTARFVHRLPLNSPPVAFGVLTQMLLEGSY